MKTTDKFAYKSPYATYEGCNFGVSKYTNNGNNALWIENTNDGHIATCSVNGNRKNFSDEISIKDWSENEGMIEFLISLGIIEKDHIAIERSGFVVIKTFKLTDSGIELFENT